MASRVGGVCVRVGVHRGCWHTWGPAGHPPWQGPALELGGSAHSHTHTQSDGGDCCDRWLLLSKSFPIKEKKSEILVGLKVLLHEEKKNHKIHCFSPFQSFPHE